MSSELELSEFLQIVSPICLHHSEPESFIDPWVFWSESVGCENNSSSPDLATTPLIHEMIKSALSNRYHWFLLGQFWAPVTIDSRRLLSTSGQPFAVSELSNSLAKYRLHSEKYKYNIDMNKLHIEPDHMILSGGPATAFLNCRASIDKPQGFPLESDNDELKSVMVPICLPFQSNCIGVLEFTLENLDLAYFPSHTVEEIKKAGLDFLFDTVEVIKDAGLDVFYVQHLIPYKTINGLQVTKDEIEEALKVVCESHNLALAQVWIPYEDTNNVPFSYSSEDTQIKRLLAIKLTGYLYAVKEDYRNDFEPYFRLGDVTTRAIGKELAMETVQDYESRFISVLRSDMLVDWEEPDLFDKTSAFAICLKSDNTDDLIYAFEFIWTKQANYVILLEAILLTLKRCLPRFKFTSGAELGDELDVHNKDDGTEFKIFQRKRSMICKTTPKVLRREVIEKQFGKTMKDAAENLSVSLSTLKRKCKEHRILEWQGLNFVKRNRNDSFTVQMNTNEEDNGAIEDISTVNPNKNVLTIKAKYEDDVINFHLPISQATFVNVEEALKVVCESHNLALAQVWIPYEDKYTELFSYFLEDSQTKGFSAIKLTGHLYAVVDDDDDDDDVSEPYFRFGDVIPRAIGKELPLVTLQDYKSRYMSKLHSDRFMAWSNDRRTSALAVCLRSNDIADFNYAFEFIWTKQSNYVILLEAILLTLKRCLPRFKFASGAELGDELDVILVDSSTHDETQKFKIFQEKRSSQMPTAPEKGKSPMVVDLIAPSMVTCKTAPKVLPREVIEKHFGKTMKEAAKDLNVSLSTLKRKVKEHRILEWQGPNFVKRNRNDSSTIQMNTNEEDNGAIEETSIVNLNKNVLTIKAEYADDMIKFHLPISQATFVRVEKEIRMKLKLSDKTYKLKYLDEDGDWIILTSDEEMADCIESSRKSDRIVVRLRVVSFLQPISGPSASLGTFFI